MRVSVRLATLTAIATALAGPVSAATYYVGMTGAWENAVGGSNVNGEGTSQVSWGIPVSGGQSGYSYVGSLFNPVTLGQEFSIGSFTHNNFRIFGDSISEIDLRLTFNIWGEGQFQSVLNFTHHETDNDGVPCAYSGGPNQNGCADRVTVSMDYDASDAFTIGGIEYYFSALGFLTGTETVDELLTAEQVATRVSLRGFLQERPVVTTPANDPVVTPLPASWLALMAALGGLALIRRG